MGGGLILGPCCPAWLLQPSVIPENETKVTRVTVKDMLAGVKVAAFEC